MALTAAEIIEEACFRAKVQGYQQTFALRNLNAILSDICQHQDFALARGQWDFNFNPALTTLFGSGPYYLPLDYLRTSGSSGATGAQSSVWYLYPSPNYPTAQPLSLVPIDIAEFDLYPKLNSQSTPELWATDMGAPLTQRIVLTTTGTLTGADGVVSSIPDTSSLLAGMGCAGVGIAPGSRIFSVDSATQVTLDTDTTAAITGASVFFGRQPLAYVYPPPLGAYPVTVRYQRQMPDIANVYQSPWFPDTGYLIQELAARLCEISDDARALNLHAMADRSMGKYSAKADDKTNRAQQVQLDMRNFGGGTPYARARNTKNAGW